MNFDAGDFETFKKKQFSKQATDETVNFMLKDTL